MQWNQIKTLFIVCFFVLNVYLLYQYLDKQRGDNFRVKEQPETSIETHLKDENIKIGNLPKKNEEETFIEVKQHHFKTDEIEKIISLDGQETVVQDESLVVGRFTDKMTVASDASDSEITSMLANKIYHLQDYKFWTWNKDLNVIVFFQVTRDRPVYYNQSGVILVFLNDENEIDFYTQTMLDESEERKEEKKKLIEAVQAVEILYRSNQLRSGDEITGANLGFYTRTPFLSGVQVFVPTWKVTVNGERNYFVNALEGLSYPGDDTDFLRHVFEDERHKLDEGNHDTLTYVSNQLNERFVQMKEEDTE